MDKEKSINNFSIVAFVLSFILFPVGLILSIIGLLRSKNYKKENGVNPKYYIFNIVGIIVSVINFLVFVFTIFIIILSVGLATSKDDEVLGNYTCTDNYYRNPKISAEFKNGKFSWGLSSSNMVIGTYRVTSRQINNNTYTYKLTLKPNNYSISGNVRIKTKEKYGITIVKNGSKSIITFDNGKLYNCYKESNNEF